jgi:hypothetical protein
MQHDHCSSSLPTRGTALTVEAVEASQGAAERTAPLKQQQVDTDVLLLGRRFRRWARMSQIRLSPMAMMPQMFLLMIMVVLVTTRLHVANAWSSSISLFAPNRNTVYRRRLSSRGGHKCRKSVWSATTSASASASASASVSLAHDLPSSTTNISTNLEHSLMDTTGGSIPPSSLSATATPQRRIPFRGALSMSIPELAQHLGGTGRAKLVWDCYSLGIDPALYFSEPSATSTKAEASTSHNDSTSTSNGDLSKLFPGSRRHQRLGADALHKLSALYADYSNTATATATEAATATATTASIAMLDGGVATLTKVIQSQDGTTKLLLHLSDQTAVETVIIPVYQQQEPEPAIRPPEQQGKGDEPISKTRNRQPQYKALHSRSTVCISSQVGCRQACTFCATGRMGKVRSLTTDEILVQYFFALQVVRLSSSASATAPSLDTPIKNAVHRALPPISNVGTFFLSKKGTMGIDPAFLYSNL